MRKECYDKERVVEDPVSFLAESDERKAVEVPIIS